jgi:DinB superfamily
MLTRATRSSCHVTAAVPRAAYCPRVDIDWNAELVDQMESHWRHQLRPRLDGLTDDEYFWQPVPDCWTISRSGESSAPISFGAGEFTMDYAPPPHVREPITTIAWRLAHIIVGLATDNASHFDGPPATTATFCYAGTAEEALRQLDDAHDMWVAGVRRLGISGLGRPQGPTQPPEFANEPMAKLILFSNLEIIHHGAEICLLRDLYLRNGAAASDGNR